MPLYQEKHLTEISRQFQIYGDILYAEPCKIGHINETYMATYNQGGTLARYIHQKINQTVFRKPVEVMDNLVRVTSHVRQRMLEDRVTDVTRRALTVIPARNGRAYYQDSDGEYWRTFVFVERAQTFESVQSPRQAYQAGKAFGGFQSLVVDLPGKRLHETIPHFHHARRRFERLQQVIAADPYNRAAVAEEEIHFALEQEPMVDVLLQLQADGELPERVTHNDTKFNNVMLDWETGEALCVLDLDTVMPGLVLDDFGDMVRTTTSPTLEDERDLAKVGVQLPVFESLAHGYLGATAPFLTRVERKHLVFAGQLMTFTIGIRFLTDYLAGDQYFRIHRPEHNLDRSRTQFKLVRSIQEQAEVMEGLVAELWQRVQGPDRGAVKAASKPGSKAGAARGKGRKSSSAARRSGSGRGRPAKG